jgi:hypothetical protein
MQFKFGEANQLRFVHQREAPEDKLNFMNGLLDELQPKELERPDGDK